MEVGVVTTDVAVAVVVSTTVAVDVVTTGQVTVGIVTTVLGSDVVATGATIPIAFMFTGAAGVVDEAMVQALIPGVEGAAVTVIAGEQAGSLALTGPGMVTADTATHVLSTVIGGVVVAVVTPGETAHWTGEGPEGTTGATTIIGVGLILNFCGFDRGWRAPGRGICCRAPALFITNCVNTPPGEGRAAANKNLQVKNLICFLFAFHEVQRL